MPLLGTEYEVDKIIVMIIKMACLLIDRKLTRRMECNEKSKKKIRIVHV